MTDATTIQNPRNRGGSTGHVLAKRSVTFTEIRTLVLASSIFDMGDAVQVELFPSDDEAMIFDGEVVNLGREHATGLYRLGIRLNTPQPGSAEMRFLDTLSERFRPCP